MEEGLLEGELVGVEGVWVGIEVGEEGIIVGLMVGVMVGVDGKRVGISVGWNVGATVGDQVAIYSVLIVLTGISVLTASTDSKPETFNEAAFPEINEAKVPVTTD